MKTFVVSKRFLLPLFVVWIVQLGYVTWNTWILYKEDLEGKGLPASIKAEWLWGSAGSYSLLTTFLGAFLVATTWYSHYKIKKDAGYRPFSPVSILCVAVIALLGFIYTSYCQPKIAERNAHLLTAIVYARSAVEFDVEIKTPPGLRNAKMMSLPELFHTRDSLASEKGLVTDRRFGFENTTRKEKEISYLIANKTRFGVVVLLFYILGVLSGASFRRVHIVFPVLIAYFILFTGWYYGQEFFRTAYMHEKLGVFWMANGMVSILGIIALCWFFILHKYGMLKPGRRAPGKIS